MSTPTFASLNASLLARKGEAQPSKEPKHGSAPWEPPVLRPTPMPFGAISIGQPAQAAPRPVAPAPAPGSVPEMKVRLQDVASTWPAKKQPRTEPAETAWVPSPRSPAPPIDGSTHPFKTTIRLTHAQARAVRLAALVLDRPQQDILSGRLTAQLEALACSDLSNCSCFKAVVAALTAPTAPGQSPDKA